MPNRNRSSQSLLSGTKVVAIVNDSDSCAQFNLYVKHHYSDDQRHLPDQALITLRLLTTSEGSNLKQCMWLVLRPENIAQHGISITEPGSIPPSVKTQLMSRSPVPLEPVDVWMLSLTLKRPGSIVHPAQVILPKLESMSSYRCFAKLGQSSTLRLFFAKDKILLHQLDGLRRIIRATLTGTLTSLPVDLRRWSDGGTHLQESSRYNFFDRASPLQSLSFDSPPPYGNADSNSRKRARHSSTLSPSPEASPSKRVLPRTPSSGSSTVPNTPSPKAMSDCRKDNWNSTKCETCGQNSVPTVMPSDLTLLVTNAVTQVLQDALPGIVQKSLKGALDSLYTTQTSDKNLLDGLVNKHLDNKLPALLKPALERNIETLVESTLDDRIDVLTNDLKEEVEEAQIQLQMTRDACLDDMTRTEADLQEAMFTASNEAKQEIEHVETAFGDYKIDCFKHIESVVQASIDKLATRADEIVRDADSKCARVTDERRDTKSQSDFVTRSEAIQGDENDNQVRRKQKFPKNSEIERAHSV